MADELALLVYRETAKFPKEELYGLSAQLKRAAVSVASNLVEGPARSSHTEYVRFVEISLGSCWELRYQLSLARRLRYLEEDAAVSIESSADETAKLIGGLLNSLRHHEANA